jgi:hypothetical protein
MSNAETETAITVPAQSENMAASITPMDMLSRALDKGANIELLEKLMGLSERWEANQARKAFDAAIAQARGEIPPIYKNREVRFEMTGGGQKSYRHEDLAEIARTIDPILGKYGLSYRFRTAAELNAPVYVTCILSHRDGHSEENSLPGPRDDSGKKNPLQSLGSTVTYLQRYTLKAALGLAVSADDDGKSSNGSDNGTISEAQIAELQRKIIDTDSDLPRFLKLFSITDLADLPASKFDEAVRALNRKAADRQRNRVPQ